MKAVFNELRDRVNNINCQNRSTYNEIIKAISNKQITKKQAIELLKILKQGVVNAI